MDIDENLLFEKEIDDVKKNIIEEKVKISINRQLEKNRIISDDIHYGMLESILSDLEEFDNESLNGE